jgi:hypothetical protein
MATMLMKAGSPVNQTKKEMMVFKDLNTNHWAFTNVMSASLLGVVEGYPDGSFRPEGNITRAEGLTMITRFSGVNKAPYEYQYFADVQPTFWTAEIIAGAQKAGLLDFLKGKPFEPAKAMTRAEAIEILYRTQFIQNILNKDLLNWDTY